MNKSHLLKLISFALTLLFSQVSHAAVTTLTGSFQITSTLNGAKCVDMNANNMINGNPADVYDCLGGTPPTQVWKFVPVSGSYGQGYEIVSNQDGRCLDVTGASAADHTPVQMYQCLGANQTNQIWQVVPNGSAYEIVNVNSGSCLEIYGGNTNNGSQLDQWNCYGGGNIHANWNLKPQKHVVYDFDGNGKSDILWYNNPTGEVTIWPDGNGNAAYSIGTVAPSSGWTIVGAADFDGDGKADIVWYNTQTGQTNIFPGGNGNEVYTLGYVAPSSGWVISQLGDFNGDGHADIVWYNTQTGQVVVWYSGNSNTSAYLGIIPPSSGWYIAKAGDFDGDGRTDLLLVNINSLQTSIWYQGNSATNNGAIGFVAPWILSQVGDFLTHGRDDILWYNPSTGQTLLWPGGQPASASLLAPAGVGQGWKLIAQLDLNGDGISDILWYNEFSGNVYTYPNGQGAGSGSLGAVPVSTGWVIKTNNHSYVPPTTCLPTSVSKNISGSVPGLVSVSMVHHCSGPGGTDFVRAQTTYLKNGQPLYSSKYKVKTVGSQ